MPEAVEMLATFNVTAQFAASAKKVKVKMRHLSHCYTAVLGASAFEPADLIIGIYRKMQQTMQGQKMQKKCKSFCWAFSFALSAQLKSFV